MPIKKVPFIVFEDGEDPKPWLPIKIVNPQTGLFVTTLGLIDTGADTCSIPAYLAKQLGHNLKKGVKKTTGTANGNGTCYAHGTTIEILHANDHNRCLFRIKNTPIDFMPKLPVVLLGIEHFLDQFVLKIDYPNQLFSIKYPRKR